MRFDVLIIGAGGAGMMCAIHAARRGRSVLLLDHASKLGGKILISGGGRCNFTNLGASPASYVSENPHFCKSALSRYPSENFIRMVQEHGIAYHEKKLGQLFCDGSAQAIVDLLKSECDQAGAEFRLNTRVNRVSRIIGETERFEVETSGGIHRSESLVIATGGLSIPKIGATGFGYDLARQFGLKLVERAAALDGFTFSEEQTQLFRELAGVSVDCLIECNGVSFRENILFTHSGLSGPAALQASLHWHPDPPRNEVAINLLPGRDARGWLIDQKRNGNRALMKNLVSEALPSRFAARFCELYFPSQLPLSQVADKAIEDFAAKLHSWKIVPRGTVGYSKAEVTRGGVDTSELSSKTMEAREVPGLYFIGEVVDVTGWLGGYNFQWAWASGWAASQQV
jgi:predicted Rossmann fold flavoprotein